jgi:uncharacterized membrane protein YgaE (UPF0421/DUF939 family)
MIILLYIFFITLFTSIVGGVIGGLTAFYLFIKKEKE